MYERITGLKPESAISQNVLSDEGKLIERFTRVGPKTLEGNYTMFNILSGSREDEKRQAEAAAKGLPDPLQSGRGGRGGRGGQ